MVSLFPRESRGAHSTKDTYYKKGMAQLGPPPNQGHPADPSPLPSLSSFMEKDMGKMDAWFSGFSEQLNCSSCDRYKMVCTKSFAVAPLQKQHFGENLVKEAMAL